MKRRQLLGVAHGEQDISALLVVVPLEAVEQCGALEAAQRGQRTLKIEKLPIKYSTAEGETERIATGKRELHKTNQSRRWGNVFGMDNRRLGQGGGMRSNNVAAL